MTYELFFAAGALVSAASLVMLFYRGRRVIRAFAQKRGIFGYLVLLTTSGFGVFAVSEVLELLEIVTPLVGKVEELNLLSSSILLLSQMIILALLVRLNN